MRGRGGDEAGDVASRRLRGDRAEARDGDSEEQAADQRDEEELRPHHVDADAIVGGVERGDRPVEGLPALIEQLVGGEALRDQRLGAVEFLLRERDLGLLLLDVGARLIEALLRSLDLRLGLVQRGGEILGVHAGDDLAGFDHVAFVGEHFRDAPGELGVDVDLVGLDPAVARCDPYRKAALTRMPPIGARAASGEDHERQQRQRFPS